MKGKIGQKQTNPKQPPNPKKPKQEKQKKKKPKKPHPQKTQGGGEERHLTQQNSHPQ